MSTRALANQNRDAQAQRRGRLLRALTLLLATVLSFATVGLLTADQLFRPDTFVIDQLKIKGSFRYLDPADVEQKVVQSKLGNFFSIDLAAIKQQVETLPWVQHADVRREWPNTLLIQIQEQRPAMRWRSDQWVNRQGQVISLPDSVQLSSPVTLSGNERDAPMMLAQTLQWQHRLAPRQISILALTVSDSQAYRLTLASPVGEFELLLGREDIERRMQRFLMLYDNHWSQAEQKIHRVDARYPDGLAIESSAIDNADSLAVTGPGLATGNKK